MKPVSDLAVLTVKQMVSAERAAISAGTPGYTLMRRAGLAVATHIQARFSPQPVLVLAGPGNNGGDGFVIAQQLAKSGWAVKVALLGRKTTLKGDAAIAASHYNGDTVRFSKALLEGSPLVVDALFGTGLTRNVADEAAQWLSFVAEAGLDVVAVDIPSGVDGDTGEVWGQSLRAKITVTFHRKKRGHLLWPGAGFCGEVIVSDIGITEEPKKTVYENDPALWLDIFPWPQPDGHKYQRGHAGIYGGGIEKTGAARLAARAALRAGAGVVTLYCDRESVPVYASVLEAVIVRVAEKAAEFDEILADPRISAFVIGPNAGVDTATKKRVLQVLKAKKSVVLDADAISVFAEKPDELFKAIKSSVVLTPHDGEFARLFGDIKGDRIVRAQTAAKRSGAVIVLKGSDTVIASPDGDVVVNSISSPFLATAGSGDVLAGIIAGLVAQRMPAFDAACAGVWLHGVAGRVFGAGLIAEDLPDILPEILQSLYAKACP